MSKSLKKLNFGALHPALIKTITKTTIQVSQKQLVVFAFSHRYISLKKFIHSSNNLHCTILPLVKQNATGPPTVQGWQCRRLYYFMYIHEEDATTAYADSTS